MPSSLGSLAILTVVCAALAGKVWAAYTTSKGWMAWAVPLAKVDLRAGGATETNDDAEAGIDDPGTHTLHILNYVPERMLTLRAELADNWPEVMMQDAGRLMNVVLVEADGESGTRIESDGFGYADAYNPLMQSFIQGNEGLFQNGSRYLANGQPAVFGQLGSLIRQRRARGRVPAPREPPAGIRPGPPGPACFRPYTHPHERSE